MSCDAVEKLVGAAREAAWGVIQLAHAMLAAGVDPDRVHGRYSSAAFEILDEIEARAILAAAGDESALRRMEHLGRELALLVREAHNELGS